MDLHQHIFDLGKICLLFLVITTKLRRTLNGIVHRILLDYEFDKVLLNYMLILFVFFNPN